MKSFIRLKIRSLNITKNVSRRIFTRPGFRKCLSWLFLFGLFFFIFLATLQISSIYGNRKKSSFNSQRRNASVEIRPSKNIQNYGSSKRTQGKDGIKPSMNFKIEPLLPKNPMPIQTFMLKQIIKRKAFRIAQLIEKNQLENLLLAPTLNVETSGSSKDSYKHSLPTTNMSSDSLANNKLSRRKHNTVSIISSSPKNVITKHTYLNTTEDELNNLGSRTNCQDLINNFTSNCDNINNYTTSFISQVDINKELYKNMLSPLFLQKYLNDKLENNQSRASSTSNISTSDLNVTTSTYISDNEKHNLREKKSFLNIVAPHRDYAIEEAVSNIQKSPLNLCIEQPTTLESHIDINITVLEAIDMERILQINKWVLPGGFWSPINNFQEMPCVPRHQIAVIVPYRDRLDHLVIFISWLHRFLRKQQLEYTVFVVEQHGKFIFNKGSIMNAGFLEAWKRTSARCFIFHDVDLLPEDDRNMYSCPDQPKHLSVAVDTFNYNLPYKGLVGGVLNMRGDHFFKTNGFSNLYWGWGGEDDDMSKRIKTVGLKLTRPPKDIAKYTMIQHAKRRQISWPILKKLLKSSARRLKSDGLNTVKYNITKCHIHPLFTHLVIDIGKPPEKLLKVMKQLATYQTL